MTQPSRAIPDEQSSTPYASALKRQAGRDTVNLMVPGHGATLEGLTRELGEFCGDRALSLDIPPLIDGIDVGPDSPFVRSTRLAAEAWGARRTWFLTNGSSQANRMAALALAGGGRGRTVLAQRSAHSSFIDGLILADLLPRFVLPSVDVERGINHGVTAEQIEAELERAERAGEPIAAVYVISPSYFGAVADVAAIADVAHRHGAPLIVDGAWGSHFGFSTELPESPTRLGADIVVSSTHKLGGSLTQSAMLHFCDGPFASLLEPLLDRAYTMTQSTSASALLLGSLDIARRELVRGGERIASTVCAVDGLRERLRADGRFPVISDRFREYADIVADDPLRVSIDVAATGLSGPRVLQILESEYGIFLEISTARAIVAFIGPGKHPDLDRFARALFEIADRRSGTAGTRASEPGRDAQGDPALPQLPRPGRMLLSPREAFFAERETVPASEAVGRISADSLAAYPPGIPNAIPGEEITEQTVAFLRAVAASPSGYVRGALDSSMSAFRVVRERGNTADDARIDG